MRSKSGVYAIMCASSEEVYVGSSVDVPGRWAQHRADLRAGRHHNERLQQAWRRHGEGAFRFVMLEEVFSRADLASAERRHATAALDADTALHAAFIGRTGNRELIAVLADRDGEAARAIVLRNWRRGLAWINPERADSGK